MFKVKGCFRRVQLSLLFAGVFFLIMLITMLLVFMGIQFMYFFGIISVNERTRLPLILFAVVSVVLGTILSAVFSRRPLKPLRQIMEASDRIAGGDYSTRIQLKGPEEFQQLNKSFNHMAEEIGSIEMLRSDFVNNFSHEFKTPIVSIRGFAKMLKRDDLSTQERSEYLDIIIDESERLTELATNVLNLSKIEQQTILTDRKLFNVSEQIRLVIALLDCKWTNKHIDIYFDSKEVFLTGNEELMKQVWINLLDNAIKFSHDYGTVEIRIIPENKVITFIFADLGEGMTDDTAKHIFDKFYQGDTSHTSKGNGLGLTIVEKILKLHGGTIRIDNSGKNGTAFIIQIPTC
jgi:signal transduction histidine kinase